VKAVDELKREGDKQGKKEQELTRNAQIPKSFPKGCVHTNGSVP
jgi:hypothetical protein